MLLSVVIPCHNEEPMVPLLARALGPVLEGLHGRHGLDCEVVIVDDGSTDGTLAAVEALSGRLAAQPGKAWRPALRWASFTRNFGKEAALACGLAEARGDFVAVMDADLQDPPELLGRMYELVSSGEWDVAAARRVTRSGEPALRSASARAFYRLMGRMSKTRVVDGERDFRLMSRAVVDAVLALPEYNRFSKGIFGWVGFRTCWVEYENRQRAAGETSWSFWGLVRYSVEGITSFSTAPLHLASGLGLLMSLVAFVGLVVIVVKTLAFGDPVSGWPSLACLVTFVGGMTLLCVGILGEYLAKVYLEVKRRPLYLVARRGSSDGEGAGARRPAKG